MHEITNAHYDALKEAFNNDIENAIRFSSRKRTTVYVFADECEENVIWSDSLSQVERDGFFPYAVVINGTVAVC